jgi:hypothetical protein
VTKGRPVRVPSPALSRTIMIVTAITMIGLVALPMTDWIIGRTLTVTYVVGIPIAAMSFGSMGLATYVERRRRLVPGIVHLSRPQMVLVVVIFFCCLAIGGLLALSRGDLTWYGADLIFLDAAFTSSLMAWRRASG